MSVEKRNKWWAVTIPWTFALPLLLLIPHALICASMVVAGGEVFYIILWSPFAPLLYYFEMLVYPVDLLIMSVMSPENPFYLPLSIVSTSLLWIIYGYLFGRKLEGRTLLPLWRSKAEAGSNAVQ